MNSAKFKGGKDNTVSSPEQKKEGLQEDTLMLSTEGRAAQETARYAQMVKEMPAVDAQRIQRAVANIKSGTYFTADAADAVAQKIIAASREGA